MERRFELAPPQPPASRHRPPTLGGEEASVRSGPTGTPTACGHLRTSLSKLPDVKVANKPRRWVFRLVVALVTLLALLAAGLAAWQFWWVGRQSAAQAASDQAAFLADCPPDATPADQPVVLPAPLPTSTPPPDGQIIGLLTLPGGLPWPIRVGTANASLDAGVGWDDRTSGPGQLGNMALVGRRLPAGGAFDNLLSLNVGDQVLMETCTTRYTYTMAVAPRDLTVQPGDTWVLDAVPGQPQAVPTDSWLTLIANQDITPSSDRAVGFAKLTNHQPL